MRQLLAALLAGSLAASATSAEPEQAKDPKAQRPAPAPLPGAAEDIRLRADQQTYEKGHYQGIGFVDLQSGELRIQADRLDLWETDKPDGTRGRRLTAEGNVVLLRGEERLAGTKLSMDLDTNYAEMEDAVGFVQPGVYVEARKIERIEADTYRIEGARFTSCAQPNPRWGFSASSGTIQIDDKIKAKNVVFKVKSVPALYIPYLAYPIKGERSSGLLFPHFGFSSFRGFTVGTGFFWAMGRSIDQTFYADHYSKVGFGLGHELRYTRDSPSRGTFRSYAFQPQSGGSWDYDIDWNVLQGLPSRFRLTGVARLYSNRQFQERYQDNFNLATNRTQRAALNLQGQVKGTQVQLAAESMDTYFGTDVHRTNRRLPSLRLARSPRRIGKSGIVFGYETRADVLGRDALDADDEVIVDYYSRFDIAPEVSRPFGSSYLQVTPRIRPRYTRYGASFGEEIGVLDGPALDRPFVEAAVEVRGPSFSRVFDNKTGFYTDRIKHVIGPEVNFLYRTKVDNFESIPKFDGYDQFLGTNQIDYALVQALYAKRPSPTGKLVPYQFFTWRIQQSYYVQIADGQNEFDPNYSSTYFGPGGVPAHFSPLLNRLRFRPTPAFSTNFDLEYDTSFNQMRTLSLGAGLNTRRVNLGSNWSRAKQVARRADRRVITRDTIRSLGGLRLPGGLSFEGTADYDLLLGQMLQWQARVRLDAQCCGFMAELIQYKYNGRDERIFRFSIELANIGSMGNFMSQDAELLRQGLAGYR